MNLMKKLNKKRIIGAVIVLILVVIGIWKIVSGNKNKITYQTTPVTKGTIISSVSASGQILTSNLINVNTEASGVVKAVYVKNGDKVYVGQRIAEITLDADGQLANAKAWVSLSSAQNSYRQTQASLANIYDQIKGHDTDETLTQKDTRTKSEVANDNAYTALASASLAYRQTSPIITSPMTGTVDNITITPGMVMTATNRVAVVTSKGNPIATFNVSEVDVNRVIQGQKATITLDSIQGKTFTGKVVTVDKIGTVTSGVTNYPVTILFDTTAPEILPNMASTANIIIDSKDDVLMVPSSAIQTQTDGSLYVKILKNKVPQNMTIEVGLSSDTQTQVLGGLNEGDEVITGTSTGTSTTVGSTSPFNTLRVGGGTSGASRLGR